MWKRFHLMSDDTQRLHEDRPDRLMVIVAHPDDADFGPSGTVARWVRAGSVAHLVCCTSGDAGADDPRTDPLELARIRETEQRAAAAHVGYEDVTFLHQPDGALANDLALRLAAAHTRREDVVVLDHAYHGHLRSTIALSPYKFRDARPARTHVAALPTEPDALASLRAAVDAPAAIWCAPTDLGRLALPTVMKKLLGLPEVGATGHVWRSRR